MEVCGIPEEAQVENIVKTLETIKALGRVRVKMKLVNPETRQFAAYCVRKEKVNTPAIPIDVVPIQEGEPWT